MHRRHLRWRDQRSDRTGFAHKHRTAHDVSRDERSVVSDALDEHRRQRRGAGERVGERISPFNELPKSRLHHRRARDVVHALEARRGRRVHLRLVDWIRRVARPDHGHHDRRLLLRSRANPGHRRAVQHGREIAVLVRQRLQRARVGEFRRRRRRLRARLLARRRRQSRVLRLLPRALRQRLVREFLSRRWSVLAPRARGARDE
mmetsp:Transcript_1298/g.5341  ORF Transcript_1298/g.5341 Transcript_1298/m.5341 type:complete len:204 (-) Transcript_1298:318-929(-)